MPVCVCSGTHTTATPALTHRDSIVATADRGGVSLPKDMLTIMLAESHQSVGELLRRECRIEFRTKRNMRDEITTPSRFTSLSTRSSAGVTLFCRNSAALRRNCRQA